MRHRSNDGARLALVGTLLLLAACNGNDTPYAEDSGWRCDDGRVVRLLVEEEWDRAILTTNASGVTLLRADAADGERWVTQTGWEFWIEDEDATLTSPGRPQTHCHAGRST